MTAEDDDDIEALLRCGRAVAEARDTMLAAAVAGVSTAELDDVGREVLTRHGARSAPQLAYDFPGTTCISVNHDVAHGIPSAGVVLADGDLVNIDVSAELDGYWTDTGASVAVGDPDELTRRLLTATVEAQAAGMAVARAGKPVRHIGRAVERRARRDGFGIIANLCGHGVGRFIHEEPSVPNTVELLNRSILHEGLVIAIEPFLTDGATFATEADDGWTLTTPAGTRVAQFEHTIVVRDGDPIVVTR